MAEATPQDYRDLRAVHRGGGPVHPFTAMRFVALGWWRRASRGDAFIGIGASYECTDTGRAALAALTAPEVPRE